MRKLFSIICALIVGGSGIALISSVELAHAAPSLTQN